MQATANTTHTTAPERHLHAVPPIVSPTATPCPPWCVIDHTDWREDGDYHYSAPTTAGPVDLNLDIDSTDTATIALRTPVGPGENLDLDEVDALIARLTELRPVLADTITQRRAAS